MWWASSLTGRPCGLVGAVLAEQDGVSPDTLGTRRSDPQRSSSGGDLGGQGLNNSNTMSLSTTGLDPGCPGLPSPGLHSGTRSSDGRGTHRTTRKRVDGALTCRPVVQAVSPVRNTSASSMQSPPASADATSVIILSPCSPAPGHRPARGAPTSSRPRAAPVRPEGAPGIDLPTAVVEGDLDPGWLRGSIYWVLLSGAVFLLPLSQKHRNTFLPLQDANPTPSFGGLGLNCYGVGLWV